MATNTRGATLRSALQTCIDPGENGLAALPDLFTDDATVWSPNIMAVGLASLVENLDFVEEALSDVSVEISAIDVVGSKGFAEFRVSATFSGPFVLSGDVVVEPNGRRLLLGAAAVADFEGDKIKALRAYFDDATLLEQMFAG